MKWRVHQWARTPFPGLSVARHGLGGPDQTLKVSPTSESLEDHKSPISTDLCDSWEFSTSIHHTYNSSIHHTFSLDPSSIHHTLTYSKNK